MESTFDLTIPFYNIPNVTIEAQDEWDCISTEKRASIASDFYPEKRASIASDFYPEKRASIDSSCYSSKRASIDSSLYSSKRDSIDSDSYSFLSPNSADDSSSFLKPIQICYNCGTDETSLWRKDESGHTVCNACKLFYKLHGRHRPKSMRRKILRRRRTRRLSKAPVTPIEESSDQIQSGKPAEADSSYVSGFDEIDLSRQLGLAQVSTGVDLDTAHFAKISSGVSSPIYKFAVDLLNHDKPKSIEAPREASSPANVNEIESGENGETPHVPTRRFSLSFFLKQFGGNSFI